MGSRKPKPALWNTVLMSKNQLILHVGFHKSGTSALQESLHMQRQELLDNGVSYPAIGYTGRKAHHRIAWALTQKPWGWKTRGGETTPYRHFSRIISRINRSKVPKIVLSTEFFSELTAEQIQKFKSAVKKRDVKIVFTIRPLAKILPSSYQQYLKYGIKADYETWLHAILDEPGVAKLTPTFWKRHLHAEVIKRWSEVFDSESVTVIVADETRPEFLYEAVNSYLELPEGLLKAQPTGTNRSLSLQEVSLLLEINNQFPKDRPWKEYLFFVRQGLVRNLTDHIPVSAESSKLLTPKWAIDKANEIGNASVEAIKGIKVEVRGSLDSLKDAKVPEGETSYASTIDIQTMAQAILAFDRTHVMRIPNSWIAEKSVRKLRRIVRRLLGRSTR
jgi:hypothetical protein